MLDPYFIVLHCPFNLLRKFKDVAHRSKAEFTLGPSSNVNLTTDTILFVDLLCTNIHASRSQFLNPPGSGVNLTPELDSNLRAPWSKDSNFRQTHVRMKY